MVELEAKLSHHAWIRKRTKLAESSFGKWINAGVGSQPCIFPVIYGLEKGANGFQIHPRIRYQSIPTPSCSRISAL
jgi:hypothetical protein